MARAQRIRASDGLRVDGLSELSRALKSIDKDLQKELRLANKSVAMTIADRSASTARSLGGVAAHVAPSIRAAAGALSASVGLGGPKFPMAGGAEFGSIKYRQFKPWRGNGRDAGYFLYPTIRDESDNIVAEYRAAIDRLLEKAELT